MTLWMEHDRQDDRTQDFLEVPANIRSSAALRGIYSTNATVLHDQRAAAVLLGDAVKVQEFSCDGDDGNQSNVAGQRHFRLSGIPMLLPHISPSAPTAPRGRRGWPAAAPAAATAATGAGWRRGCAESETAAACAPRLNF
eukprot:gene25236-biopygen4488